MNPEEISKVEKAANFIMPWGAYKGIKIQSVKSSYLRWLAEKSTNDKIAEYADLEWRFREEHGDHF